MSSNNTLTLPIKVDIHKISYVLNEELKQSTDKKWIEITIKDKMLNKLQQTSKYPLQSCTSSEDQPAQNSIDLEISYTQEDC